MHYQIPLEGYHGRYQDASKAVQKISTKDTGVARQLTKTANFIATPMKKTFGSLLPAYWRYKLGFCLFFLTNKNE